MRVLSNPHRGKGLDSLQGLSSQLITDPSRALELFARCTEARVTPLRDAVKLANVLGVDQVRIKDERNRMGLGSFKALGAIHAIARLADERARDAVDSIEISSVLRGEVFVCASAGNHGLSVASGARIFGAEAVVYISELVPEDFVARLNERGATVVQVGEDYEASMAAAAAAADENGWYLLSDSTWPGYFEPARRVMEGYLIMGAEVMDLLSQPPTHIVLQAGVGGMAAAMAAFFRNYWSDDPVVVVVEPESAACLFESVQAGKPVVASGPASLMSRLDCKETSQLALACLAVHADLFVTIGDDQCVETVDLLTQHDLATTPSGAAGAAAVHHGADKIGLSPSSRVLVFITEGEERSDRRKV